MPVSICRHMLFLVTSPCSRLLRCLCWVMCIFKAPASQELLMTTLMSPMQLPKLVDSKKLRTEVQRVLTKSRHSSRQQAALPDAGTAAGQEQMAVLLSWCQAVCACYGLEVHSFKSSFADACGLCLLVRSFPCQSSARVTIALAGQCDPPDRACCIASGLLCALI